MYLQNWHKREFVFGFFESEAGMKLHQKDFTQLELKNCSDYDIFILEMKEYIDVTICFTIR